MPAQFVTTADAVDRETAWLCAYGDGLPPLLVANGGPFDSIEAYLPRTPRQRTNRVYVLRPKMRIERFGMRRRIVHYEFELDVRWVLSSGGGDFQADQRAMDAALDALVARIGGLGSPRPDKTHGGAFMSVAEDPCLIDVQTAAYEMPTAGLEIETHVTYTADDPDFDG